MRKASILFYFLISAGLAHAAPVAKLSQVRGIVQVKKGKDQPSQKAKLGQPLDEGDTVTTGKNSAAKILFESTKAEVVLGPDSSLKTNSSQPGMPNMAQLVGGKARVKLAAISDAATKKKPRFILRTKSATMGVRGTDFLTTYNPNNESSATITFDGSVAMVKTDLEDTAPQAIVEKLTGDSVVLVTEGAFATAATTAQEVTIPTKISPAQFESLKSNASLVASSAQEKSVVAQDAAKYIPPVPPGVDSKNFISAGKGVEGQLANVTGLSQDALDKAFARGASPPGEGARGNFPPPEGMLEGGRYAPPAGGFINIETATYIAPPPGSAFDPNTQTYVVPTSFGAFNDRGDYVPPRGWESDKYGNIVPENYNPALPGATPGGTGVATPGTAAGPAPAGPGSPAMPGPMPGPATGPMVSGPTVGPYSGGPMPGPAIGPYVGGPAMPGPMMSGPAVGPYVGGPMPGPAVGPYVGGPMPGPAVGPYMGGPMPGPAGDPMTYPGPYAGPYTGAGPYNDPWGGEGFPPPPTYNPCQSCWNDNVTAGAGAGTASAGTGQTQVTITVSEQ